MVKIKRIWVLSILLLALVLLTGCTSYTFDNIECPEDSFVASFINSDTGEYQVVCKSVGNITNITGGDYPTLQEVLTQGNTATSDIITTGNITALYFIGNGSQLTGLPSPDLSTYLKINQTTPQTTTGTFYLDSISSVSEHATIPNLTGSITMGFYDASSDASETGDVGIANYEVWGYKDINGVKLWTANSLTAQIDTDDSPYDYVGVSGQLTGVILTDYDGFLWKYFDIYYYDWGITNDYVEFDDDLGWGSTATQTTDPRDYTTVAYTNAYKIETNGIAGENGTGILSLFSDTIARNNFKVEGNTTLADTEITNLNIRDSFTSGYAYFNKLFGTLPSKSNMGVGLGTGNNPSLKATKYSGLTPSISEFYWDGNGWNLGSKFRFYPTSQLTLIGAGGMSSWSLRFDGGDSFVRNTDLIVGTNALTSSERFNVYGNQWMSRDNNKIIFGTGKDANIKYDGTNLVFDTSVVGTGIAYFSDDISATGFITRTEIYDKAKGSALDKIKDSSELTKTIYDEKGLPINEIDHSKFYGYTQFETTDYSKPVIENYQVEECNEKGEKCLNVTKEKTTYPYKKMEEGVNIVAEIELLRQALYEQKQINSYLQQQIGDLKKIK